MNVDGSLSDRELTLVKLPDYVAKEWKRLISASVNGKDASMSGCQLATIRVGEGQEELELVPEAVSNNGPKEFTLKKLSERSQTYVISHQNGQHKVEGKIDTSYNSVPKRAGNELHPDYKKRTKQQEEQVNTPMMSTKLDEQRQLRAGRLDREQQVTGTRQIKKLNLSTQEFLDQKDALEAKLFEKFERQAYWRTSDLMNKMGLTGPQLSQILKEIAVLNAVGPYKQHWSLKKEYQTSKE